MSKHVIQLTAAVFSQTVLEAAEPVLVDFWAPWCAPCRALAPAIEALAGEYQGRAKVCKLNIDDESALATQYGVMSIPTVLLFHQGKEQTRVVGLRGKEDYAELIDKLIH